MIRAGTRMIVPSNPYPFKLGDKVIDTERNRRGTVDGMEHGTLWLLSDGVGRYPVRTAVCIPDQAEAARQRARIITATPKAARKGSARPRPPLGTVKFDLSARELRLGDFVYAARQYHLVTDMRAHLGGGRVLLFRTRKPLVVAQSAEVYRRPPIERASHPQPALPSS